MSRFGAFRPVVVLLAALTLTAAGCTEAPTAPAPARWSSSVPGLVCPAAFTVVGVTGSAAPVSYPPPTAAGGTDVENVTCAPASGSSFSLGSTLVTCRGVDRLNREAACGFVVTLESSVLSVKTFVAFGDSVTLGENALPGVGLTPLVVDLANAYPTKLQARFDADFPGQGVKVFNEGKSGERATDAVARLPGVLTARQPGALLLLDGYNDLLNDGAAAVVPVSTALRDMVRLAKARGVAHVFVSTVTPSRPGQRQIGLSVILDANFLIRQMAAAEGAVLVDAYDAFFGQEAVLVGNDGLHLTPAGNDALASAFYDAIRTAVPASQPDTLVPASADR